MCGGLVTYLRMCGHDTAYALDRAAESDEAVLAWARGEDRPVVTRDADLAAAAPAAIRLESRDVRDQLAELRDAGLDLTLPDEPTRCSRCNGELEGTAEADPLPEYVPDDPPSPVWRCPDCGHHYWRGSHWEDVRETLAAVENAADIAAVSGIDALFVGNHWPGFVGDVPIAGDDDDERIAHRRCFAEIVDVSGVKDVEGSLCDDAGHRSNPPSRNSSSISACVMSKNSSSGGSTSNTGRSMTDPSRSKAFQSVFP